VTTKHDAFISYSHAADGRLAPAVESGLERLARPLLTLRAIDVFRDETSLAANPELWTGILDHLDGSTWFVLMASPQSAASHWCNKEMLWWLENRGKERMLVLLTGGEIAWDDERRDFDWTRTTALPRTLSGKLSEPLFVDLRWARTQEKLTLSDSRFRAAILDIAAPIRGIPKDQLDGADVRQLRRDKRLVRGLQIAAGVAGLGVLGFAAYAVIQRNEAIMQRDAAISGKLAAESRQRESRKPDLAMLLAAQAWATAPTPEASDTLLAVIASNQRLVAYLRPPLGELRKIAISADGRQLAALGLAELQAWDVERRLPLGPPVKKPSGAFDIAYARTPGTLVALSYSAGYFLVAVDPVSGRKLATSRVAEFDESQPEAISPILDADADQIALKRRDGSVEVWEYADAKIRRVRAPELSPQGAERAAAALRSRAEGRSRDGKWQVSASRYSADMFLTGPAPGRTELVREALHGHELGVPAVAFDPGGRFVATAGEEGNVLLWRLHGSLLARRTVDVSFLPSRLSFTRGGALFVAGANSGWALYDTHGRSLLAEPQHTAEGSAGIAAVSNDGRLVAQRASFFQVQLRSTADGSPVGEPLLGKSGWAPLLIAFGPNDDLLAAGGRDNDVMLWDLRSRNLIAKGIKGHSGGYLHGLHTFAFSPDGHLLATGGRDKKIFLWDTATGKPLGEPLVGHPGAIEALAFSPDGRMLAAGGAVDRVTLYDLPARKALDRRLSAANVGTVTRLEFSPRGDLLVGAGFRQLTVWRLENGEPIFELSEGVREAAFNRDGTLLAIPAGEKAVALYDFKPGNWIASVCETVQRNLTCEEWTRHVGDQPYRKLCAALPGPETCAKPRT